MKEEEIKIVIKDNRVITLKELFKEKKFSRKKMAELTFEKKINMLINLQKTASNWGGMKDVIIWQ